MLWILGNRLASCFSSLNPPVADTLEHTRHAAPSTGIVVGLLALVKGTALAGVAGANLDVVDRSLKSGLTEVSDQPYERCEAPFLSP